GVRPRCGDVQHAIPVQIRNRETIYSAFVVTKANGVEFPPGTVVEVDRRWRLDVADDDVLLAITVYVGDGKGIWRDGAVGHDDGCRERTVMLAKVDRRSLSLIDRDEIHETIAVEIRRCGHPDRRVGRPERNRPLR